MQSFETQGTLALSPRYEVGRHSASSEASHSVLYRLLQMSSSVQGGRTSGVWGHGSELPALRLCIDRWAQTHRQQSSCSKPSPNHVRLRMGSYGTRVT